jgi:hypothetical protein
VKKHAGNLGCCLAGPGCYRLPHTLNELQHRKISFRKDLQTTRGRSRCSVAFRRPS